MLAIRCGLVGGGSLVDFMAAVVHSLHCNLLPVAGAPHTRAHTVRNVRRMECKMRRIENVGQVNAPLCMSFVLANGGGCVLKCTLRPVS